jgi:hypothetical protein
MRGQIYENNYREKKCKYILPTTEAIDTVDALSSLTCGFMRYDSTSLNQLIFGNI